MCNRDERGVKKKTKKKKAECGLAVMTAFKELGVNLTYQVNR